MQRRVLSTLAILGTLMGLLAPPAHAGSPGWIVRCSFSHSLPDDPIVRPGQAGASHLHDFLGNRSTQASSTYSSMVAGGTNCRDSADTAGYWVPSLYRNGVKVAPSEVKVYYRDSGLAAGTMVRAFPADFRMIAGVGTATSAAGNSKLGSALYWGCSDNSTGKLKGPTSCGTGKISLHVGFPYCWNGRDLDSPDHRAHVAYPSKGRCPSTHPVALPRVILRLEYPTGSSLGSIALSSGGSWTIHGDFWNTWRQSRLDTLVARCLNADRDCGTPGNAAV